MKERALQYHSGSLEVIIHLLAWMFLFGFPHMMMVRGGENVPFHKILCMTGPPLLLAVVFYLNYLILVPKYLLNHRTKRYLTANVVLVVLAFFLLQGWFWLMEQLQSSPDTPSRPPHQADALDLFLFRTRDLVLFVFAVALAAVIHMGRNWHHAELRRQQAELKQTEAELQSLRNQINPHFLLNTLNNIYALIAFNTEKAQQAVQDLSKLLRHLLYENKETFTELAKEIEFLRNYVALMQIRLSSNVDLVFETHLPENGSIRIAPLIFVSLIENAFKHGVSSTAPCFIHIRISATQPDGAVECRIENSNFPKRHNDVSGSGVGLDQVQRRLELIYPHRYVWNKGVYDNGRCYRSILTIQTANSHED